MGYGPQWISIIDFRQVYIYIYWKYFTSERSLLSNDPIQIKITQLKRSVYPWQHNTLNSGIDIEDRVVLE